MRVRGNLAGSPVQDDVAGGGGLFEGSIMHTRRVRSDRKQDCARPVSQMPVAVRSRPREGSSWSAFVRIRQLISARGRSRVGVARHSRMPTTGQASPLLCLHRQFTWMLGATVLFHPAPGSGVGAIRLTSGGDLAPPRLVLLLFCTHRRPGAGYSGLGGEQEGTNVGLSTGVRLRNHAIS